MLYQLRKQYGGGPVDIYKLIDSTVDLCSGVPIVQKEKIRVQRALILPARVERTFIQNISKISADKQFVYGGTYDRSRRMFIIDRRNCNCELPKDCVLDLDDYIVFNGRKYEIKHFDDVQFDSVWVIIAQHVLGEPLEEIHCVCAEDRCTLAEVIDVE